MNKGKFKTNLIGANDLLLGKGNQLQERWGALKEVSKITLLQPLSSFNELKALDTTKFYYAMVTGKFSEADELAGYFYYFDCESVETENLPLIVAPNKGVGRWKIIPYALDKIKAYVEDRLNQYVINELPDIAKVEVTKQAEVVVPDIAKDIIEEQLPTIVEEAVQQALVAVNARIDTAFTRGTYYNSALTYPSSNYNSIFVKNSDNSLAQRTYIATESTNESPVTGTEISSENGVTIYSNNAVLQDNSKYKRVKYDNVTRYKIDIAGGTSNFSFLSGSHIQITNFYGTMTFKLYGASKAYPICSFDVQFFTENDIKFNNVFYDSSIRQRDLGSDTYGYLAFGGFSFVNVLDGSLKCCLRIDESFKLLYTYMEVESVTDFTLTDNFVQLRGATPTLVDCFAVRPNGGSEIADMGIIYPSLREGGNSAYESFDYYLFKNGYIWWHEAIVLPTYYTQYHDTNKFASLNIDPSDKYIANIGEINGLVVGASKDGQAPNIAGSQLGYYGNGTNYYGYEGNIGNVFWAVNGCFTSVITSPTAVPVDYLQSRGITTRKTIGFGIDASLSNPIYSDSASTIETARIVTSFVMRGF